MSDTDDNNDEMENGHISLSNSNLSGSGDTDDETVQQPANAYEFDMELPTTHKYMGNLNSVRGYTLYDEGEIVETIAVYTHTFVFPGFTLPLILSEDETKVMQRFLEKKNLFVLITTNSKGIFQYAVAMQIFETQIKDHALNLKAQGRQRCVLTSGSEVNLLTGRLQKVTVKMLSEPAILSPLCDSQMLSLKKKMIFDLHDYEEIKKNFKFRRHHLCQYPLPSWIYDHYEISYFVKKILEKLTIFSGDVVIPKDPIKLSYWVVQNCQLRDDERLRILKLDSAVERLRMELHFLNENRIICCLHCCEEITSPRNIISMSKDGTQNNYVNPNGCVYETLTVSFADNFILIGRSSSQFSWFPGYEWTIMQCRNCNMHLGWKFTSKTLTPKCFYGLAKRNLNIVVSKTVDTEKMEYRDFFINNLCEKERKAEQENVKMQINIWLTENLQ